MPWSPPKKTTIIISLILELVGVLLGVIALNYIPGLTLDIIYALIGFLLCLIGWFLMLLGVLFKGI